jgi:hypothetical protein
MASFVEACVRAYACTAALAKYRRVKLSGGVLAYAGSTDQELGTLVTDTFAVSDAVDAGVKLRNSNGTELMVASEAITAQAEVYAAANGKIAASGTVRIGRAQEAAGADGDVIEVLRDGEASTNAAAGGTTASAFLVDSDSSTPRIELAAQTGGTGNYKATLKPPGTLTGNRVFTLPADGDATLLSDYVQTLTANSDSGAGSSIVAGVTAVDVTGVTADANDWIVLPAIAGVPIGHTIRITCNAGSNFELRTPAASNTKINDVDADGSQEYLCTDTDLIIVTKRTTTGWVAQSITKLGAVRTAVIPD